VLVSEPGVSGETPEKTARYVTSVATILLKEKSDYFLVDLGIFLGLFLCKINATQDGCATKKLRGRKRRVNLESL
jgi:hypothetical protein